MLTFSIKWRQMFSSQFVYKKNIFIKKYQIVILFVFSIGLICFYFVFINYSNRFQVKKIPLYCKMMKICYRIVRNHVNNNISNKIWILWTASDNVRSSLFEIFFFDSLIFTFAKRNYNLGTIETNVFFRFFTRLFCY